MTAVPIPPAAPCPDCGQPIRWLPTVAGNRMPVDAAPDGERGNVMVRLDGHLRVLGKPEATTARAQGIPLYLHHAVSCTQAGRWHGRRHRRRTRGGEE